MVRSGVRAPQAWRWQRALVCLECGDVTGRVSFGVRLFAVGKGCESVSVTCVSAVRSLCARARAHTAFAMIR